MDQSIKGQNKTVFSSRTVTQLINAISKSVKEKELQPKKCPEFQTLKEKCGDSKPSVAYTAIQGMSQLVKREILTGSQAISSLISLLPSVAFYTPLVITMGDIILHDRKNNETYQYNLLDKIHPFIIVLKHDIDKSWDSVINYIQFFLYKNNDMKIDVKLNFLRPVLFYVVCDKSYTTKRKNDLFLLLMEEDDSTRMKSLVIEMLAWQKVDGNYCWLIQKVFKILLKSIGDDEQLMIEALTPSLAVAVKWAIVNGHNPVVLIDLLTEALKVGIRAANSVVYILSDVILECPPMFFKEVIELCIGIIYSYECNLYIAYKFAAVSLIWTMNASSSTEVRQIENMITFLTQNSEPGEWRRVKKNLNDNLYFQMIKNSDPQIKVAHDVGVMTDRWDENKTALIDWLKKLLNSDKMEVPLQGLISGIYMLETDKEILETCLNIIEKYNSDTNISFTHLCLTFFKLCRELDPMKQLTYLKFISKFANVKDNIPLIIGIFERLKSENSQTALSVVIDLYIRLYQADKRTYPYLHKALFSSAESSWELNVIRTMALREICRASPDIHGKNLVSKLSEILNDCDGYVSGLPSAIAIEAVIELCKACVIDISGTWKALKPKLSRDKRTEVIASLCKLFSVIPVLKPEEGVRQALIDDVIPLLWSYALSNNPDVVKSALSALSQFDAETYGPKLLPGVLKMNIKLPKQLSKDDKNTVEALDYIPGECWLQLLRITKPECKSSARKMISSLIEDELKKLPRRFFCHPGELPEPTTYTLLPHYSVCRALVTQLKEFLDTGENDILDDVLDILGSDYSKCLPLLDWSFLNGFFDLGEDFRKKCVGILVKQSAISKATRLEFEKYATENVEKFSQVDDFIFLYPSLPYVCNALGPNNLRQFLDKTIRICSSSSLNSETDYFDTVVRSVKNVLDSKIVPEPRKALLVTHMKNILKYLPPKHRILDSYGDFVAGLPAKMSDSIISPISWSKITPDNIKRSVLIRTVVAIKSESAKPVAGFKELVEATLLCPEEHNTLIDGIIQVLQMKRSLCHDYWLEELIRMIQMLSSSNSSNSVKGTLFLLDVFILSTITITGYNCFLQDIKEARSSGLDIFPIALLELLSQHQYSPLGPKIIEWVHSLTRWKDMPEIYIAMLQQSILAVRDVQFSSDKNKFIHVFYDAALNSK